MKKITQSLNIIFICLLISLTFVGCEKKPPSDFDESTAKNAIIQYYNDKKNITLTDDMVVFESWDNDSEQATFSVTAVGGESESFDVKGLYYVQHSGTQYLVFGGNGDAVFGYIEQ